MEVGGLVGRKADIAVEVVLSGKLLNGVNSTPTDERTAPTRILPTLAAAVVLSRVVLSKGWSVRMMVSAKSRDIIGAMVLL